MSKIAETKFRNQLHAAIHMRTLGKQTEDVRHVRDTLLAEAEALTRILNRREQVVPVKQAEPAERKCAYGVCNHLCVAGMCR